jgi:hypothetical protein
MPGKAALTDGKTAHYLRKALTSKVRQTIRPDDLTNLLRRPIEGDELFPIRNIRSKVAGIEERRGTDRHVDLGGAGIPKHTDNPV